MGNPICCSLGGGSFQFLGIPPKGEHEIIWIQQNPQNGLFPISRDPPEGGTCRVLSMYTPMPERFPISRDPPEGGTRVRMYHGLTPPPPVSNF